MYQFCTVPCFFNLTLHTDKQTAIIAVLPSMLRDGLIELTFYIPLYIRGHLRDVLPIQSLDMVLKKHRARRYGDGIRNITEENSRVPANRGCFIQWLYNVSSSVPSWVITPVR